MKSLRLVVAAAAISLTATPVVAQTTTYNTDVTGGFQYGSGNNYAPANATVLTNDNLELAVRFHEYQQVAPASANGVYAFNLGTVVSFDYSIGGVNGQFSPGEALITLTNLLTGQTASYNPFIIPDNTITAGLDVQNSARLSFGFLNGGSIFGNLGFNPNIDNTYRIDLTSLGNTVTSFAQVGAGAPAVPEPATWAMMLLGFGAVGFSMRRGRKPALLAQAA